MAFSESFAGYFEDFGESVSIGTSTALGIVDAGVDEFNRVLASAVVVTAVVADFPAIAAGQAATIRGVTYTVRAVEPDGTGMMLVKVSKP
jgi:hypothetical protein